VFSRIFDIRRYEPIRMYSEGIGHRFGSMAAAAHDYAKSAERELKCRMWMHCG
jgi:hypothetical protein